MKPKAHLVCETTARSALCAAFARCATRGLCFVTALLIAWFGLVSAWADEPLAGVADFESRVLPILVRECSECHQADSPEAGLRLASLSDVLAGSESGPVLVPGRAAQSLLLQVLAKQADPHMPPEGQLSTGDVAVIARWIDALDPNTKVGASKANAGQSRHWSFQPVKRPAVPTVRNASWSRTPIDHFILAQLEEAGLQPSGPADRTTLLRRVYFDLIGLPPSPDELSAFVSNQAPDAYQRVVERLLASPHYGERWGRHWLDLARYADSSGFHNDFDRPNAWRYRDYVIASLNADKPYGQFVVEQLAGDEMPEATPETWIATGFGRNGPSNEDNMGMGLAKQKYRLDQLDDVVSTTSNVFLGLTLGCARCHDHKYDPLAQRDYYRFLAFFETAEPRRLALDGFRRQQPQLKPVSTKPDATPLAMVLTSYGQPSRPTHLLWRGDVRNPGPVVEAGVPVVLGGASAPTGQLQTPAEASAEGSAESNPQQSRLALANWIVDVENPLTWRVMANRLWQHHFGRGLVATPSNFGLLGERPTHPKLLDWLASELIRADGSPKSLHRLIVNSAAYRQVSTASGPGQRLDPDNRLLWRMNKRRLEAEPLRDAVLSVAGNLNLRMGGPGVKPRIRPDLLIASQRNKWPVVQREGPEHWRRSVYVYVKRQLQLPLLELFDAPSTTHSCARRPQSLVPTQSLVLLNDEFAREQAGYFADRVVHDVGADFRAQVERAMLIALGRTPDDRRLDEATAFLESQAQRLVDEGLAEEVAGREALTDFCHVLMNLSEFVYVD